MLPIIASNSKSPSLGKHIRTITGQSQESSTPGKSSLYGILFLLCAFVPFLAEAAPKDLPEKELFGLSSKLFLEEKDKTEAVNSFNIFLERFANSKRADKAQFMLGECLFENNKDILKTRGLQKNMFSSSIGAYQRLLDKYPKSNLADDAFLRIGECSYNQQDYVSAISWFRNLIKKYPRSYLSGEALVGLGQCYLSCENEKCKRKKE